MKTDNKSFESIVIGTSPLMLLVAINIAKKGSSVLIIDKNLNLGGCWQIHTYDDLKIDSASHLIESYPGVYKILEDYSLIKFGPLEDNPVRIFKNGLTLPYQNQIILVLTFIKLFIGYIYNGTISILFKKNIEQSINYSYKFKDFLKYRLKTFFENSILYLSLIHI